VLASGPPAVAIGRLQLSFTPWLKPLVTPLVTIALTMDFSDLWKHCYRWTHASFHKV